MKTIGREANPNLVTVSLHQESALNHLIALGIDELIRYIEMRFHDLFIIC